MDLRKLKKLIDLVEESGIAELEVTENEEKVRIVKGGGAAPVQYVQTVAAAPAAAPAAGAPAVPAIASAPAPEAAPAGHAVKSPMVGTFYRSPAPDAEPFAKVGDHVTPDSVLCIIEAMKVMNEIKAELEGEVVEVLAQNGEPVDYGQPLFVIKV